MAETYIRWIEIEEGELYEAQIAGAKCLVGRKHNKVFDEDREDMADAFPEHCEWYARIEAVVAVPKDPLDADLVMINAFETKQIAFDEVSDICSRLESSIEQPPSASNLVQ